MHSCLQASGLCSLFCRVEGRWYSNPKSLPSSCHDFYCAAEGEPHERHGTTSAGLATDLVFSNRMSPWDCLSFPLEDWGIEKSSGTKDRLTLRGIQGRRPCKLSPFTVQENTIFGMPLPRSSRVRDNASAPTVGSSFPIKPR